MSWTPRYFDDITTARSVIRSNLPIDKRDSITEPDLDVHLEQKEIVVDDFLVSCGWNLDSLETDVKTNARILHTYRTLLSILNILPMKDEHKTALEARFLNIVQETERRLMSRKFPPRLVKPVTKRISPGWGTTSEASKEWKEGEDYF